jgi:hypothetical protein
LALFFVKASSPSLLPIMTDPAINIAAPTHHNARRSYSRQYTEISLDSNTDHSSTSVYPSHLETSLEK